MNKFIFSKKDMENCVEEFHIFKEKINERRSTEKSSIDLESIKKSVNLFLK